MGQKGLTEDEATLILEEASDAPRHMKADDLAAWLGCTYADRETLRLTRIGACDIGPQARAELRKRKARLRAQRRRHDKGAKPRADWEAEHSISRTRRHQPPDVVPTPPRRWHRSVRSRPLPYRCAHTCATSEEAIRERHPTD
jgi:hypothetical protein